MLINLFGKMCYWYNEYLSYNKIALHPWSTVEAVDHDVEAALNGPLDKEATYLIAAWPQQQRGKSLGMAEASAPYT